MATGKSSKRKNGTRIEASSGNVFGDLELGQPEERLAKAKLAEQICRLIAKRGLNQTEAAGVLGVSQPKVSALMRGRLEGLSSGRLLRFLTALDCDVKIVLRPKPAKRKKPASIEVVTGV
jgi:predicted XRE-type DNA-binding protein